jgi:molybdopterin-guanine dinucleotide biosynthesis protein A
MGNSLIVFAGGRATRLGGVNKALLTVGDRTIVQRILDELGPLTDERLILTNDDTLSGLSGVRLIHDAEPHAGVLTALANGLATATGDVCLTVACDMPFVSRNVFEYLLRLQREHNADVVIPHGVKALEPLHAVYRRARVEAAIRDALARGEQRMISYFGVVRVREVPGSELKALDPTGRAFFNVNTPADLAEAQRLVTISPPALSGS